MHKRDGKSSTETDPPSCTPLLGGWGDMESFSGIPDEEQTNNRGELRAALAALRGHKRGSMSLICPDQAFA